MRQPILAALAAALAATALAVPPSLDAPEVHAITHARVIVRPGHVVEDATILIRDGVIAAVGPGVAVPPGALTWDASGHVVHAGFVDAHLGLSRFNGLAKPEKPKEEGADTPPPAGSPFGSTAGWGHPKVHPEVRARDWLKPDAKSLESLRAQGFTAACVVPDHGILRGRDVIVALDGGEPGASVLAENGDVHAAFDAGGWGSDLYPNSVMGATAVLRQSLLDAGWYRRARAVKGTGRVAEDASLEALGALLPEGRARRGSSSSKLVVACRDVLDDLRAHQVASEAGAGLRLRAAGDEYRRLAEVVALGVPLVVPVTFPPPPTVADETEWLDVPDEQLRHWKAAPDNARWLRERGADVALTTDGIDQLADFTLRVRRMIEHGLKADDALAMLTTAPAAMLGLSDRLGTVEAGRLAHLVVSTGEPFAEGTEIRETWVDGLRFVISRAPTGPAGTWNVVVSAAGRTFPATLELSAKEGSLQWEKGAGGPGDEGEDSARKASVSDVRIEGDVARFTLAAAALGLAEKEPVTARVVAGVLTAGDPVAMTGSRAPKKPKAKPDAAPRVPASPPKTAGGRLSSESVVLFRGGTAWTSAADGVLEATDVLVRDGVIAAVGPKLAAPAGALVVDLRGRHLTPGLIDAHSHSAIVGGVNEGTNSCTAEVRIGDVVNSETIDIYRLLAGGLTTANLLHGSANCMGGQSQVIRLKWGEDPEGLKFAEAWPMIKFALGENVKQSNWGEKYVSRYPQTRMGVEQFMREKFQAARDWEEAYEARPARGRLPVRRDLQLETLAEILRGERKIHCHSYRQDEILGFMRVAEEFGFRVGTFQHILEGYKVADEMAAHGAAASSFTDWWAYKFEVYDAIPYNPALLWERGVLTSVNSDSTELARRMQLEAAKVVKWGGVPEAEALKFVTINAAKQLGIDSVVGSIEPGKQADLAVWSGHPLSTSSLCESTWIQGVKYFDRAEDLASRTARKAERDALVEEARRARAGDDVSGEAWNPSYVQASRGCSEEGGMHAHGDAP